MAHDPAIGAPPPRVIVAMPDQWTRALLRAALREDGYDAIGAHGVREAFRVPPVDPERGPVRLLIVDQDALTGGADALLERLTRRFGGPDAVLVKRATRPLPDGEWRRVLQRPVSVADVVDTARALVPLPTAARRPVD